MITQAVHKWFRLFRLFKDVINPDFGAHVVVFMLTLIILQSIGANAQVRFNDDHPPDYSVLHYWAAHPDKEHPGNLVPENMDIGAPTIDDVDIFYIHPTTFAVKKPKTWNGELDSEFINELTDNKPLKYQASLFNQVGTLYAPRYRQAHLSLYGYSTSKLAERVFDLAYSDVKAAFLYYVKYLNDGRPFILASHSQGTTHAIRLIKEVIDESPPLQEQLIVAYLVGMPVSKDEFGSILPCEKPEDVGCFTSWRTYRVDHDPPDYFTLGEEVQVTNPMTWDIDRKYADVTEHKGAVLRNFNKVFYQILEAEAEGGVLWVSRPKFPFSFLMTRKNYHIADYNFFYYNVQENALERVKAYYEAED